MVRSDTRPSRSRSILDNSVCISAPRHKRRSGGVSSRSERRDRCNPWRFAPERVVQCFEIRLYHLDPNRDRHYQTGVVVMPI
jgi:hypothetical protein